MFNVKFNKNDEKVYFQLRECKKPDIWDALIQLRLSQQWCLSTYVPNVISQSLEMNLPTYPCCHKLLFITGEQNLAFEIKSDGNSIKVFLKSQFVFVRQSGSFYHVLQSRKCGRSKKLGREPLKVLFTFIDSKANETNVARTISTWIFQQGSRLAQFKEYSLFYQCVVWVVGCVLCPKKSFWKLRFPPN